MSAWDDIWAALQKAPALPAGWERAVLVGQSARRSIHVSASLGLISDEEQDQIGEVPLRNTLEFDGWVIRDIDPAGVWHEVEFI